MFYSHSGGAGRLGAARRRSRAWVERLGGIRGDVESFERTRCAGSLTSSKPLARSLASQASTFECITDAARECSLEEGPSGRLVHTR